MTRKISLRRKISLNRGASYYAGRLRLRLVQDRGAKELTKFVQENSTTLFDPISPTVEPQTVADIPLAELRARPELDFGQKFNGLAIVRGAK
jgi:hypothetical protein